MIGTLPVQIQLSERSCSISLVLLLTGATCFH